ncbi:dihydroneopterin aldolase [Synechococcus elongatus]|uniref:7,8-dihydroneopterin aldolase n=3 Tax=Synechococcus elongatus TaxID=32046 RepID=Q31S97_SYNE7|nr:dihydroneopterin aldolase [Synechococcus elongatus]MBD2688973.1 dihydroneopterin aldolase [Synechococcus elongatus FACHB-1061]UOW75264.1 dihydroneopterin aldolase [Synechococcus elongatus PCC 6301]ABB56072.1 dihydroneopterin aldolase Dihydroneopterin aldolase [Synechococcus elongatus PCC 7942 = FACHB-805]AJD56866.1 dihydroneopterin aldolase [Synechococcus elongatus UTEX 2973]MBD2587905.1 dihydroneopterin aldolase [Synechococcus elongatus FACHB-242]
MDVLVVRGIRAYGYTGFFDAEQELGQWFEVDLRVWVDLQPAGDSDQLGDTLDYSQAVQVVQTGIRQSRFRTIERLAADLCDRLFQQFPALPELELTLRKLAPPIPDFSGDVSLVLRRSRKLTGAD